VPVVLKVCVTELPAVTVRSHPGVSDVLVWVTTSLFFQVTDPPALIVTVPGAKLDIPLP
jgi:hypothetical protein